MSNYTKTTNFAAKDTLPTSDPLRVIVGSEFDVEFNGIQSSIATKADTSYVDFAISSSTGVNTFASVKTYGAIGDGVADDTQAIQDAIDNNSSVFFPSGTYKVLGTVTVPSNVTLLGEGGSIIDGASPTTASIGIFRVTEKANVTVRGMLFIYDTDVETSCSMFSVEGSDNVKFYDNTFTSENGSDAGNTAAIRIVETATKGSKDIIITNNNFTGPRLLVLTQAGSGQRIDNVIITSNIFTQNTDTVRIPNILDGVVKIDLGTDNVVFSDNICDGANKTEGFVQVEEDINNITITGNTIRDCLGYGVFIYGGQQNIAVNNVTITSNVLINAGIYLADFGNGGAGEFLISNNVINGTQALVSGAAVDGISLQYGTAANIVISGNVIKEPNGRGITNKYSNAIISNNQITDAVGYAIYNNAGNYNTITNNTIGMNGAGSSYGIGLNTAYNGLINGNLFYGAGAAIDSGIVLISSVRVSVQNNFIDLPSATNGVLAGSNCIKINISNNTIDAGVIVNNSASNSSVTNNVNMGTI